MLMIPAAGCPCRPHNVRAPVRHAALGSLAGHPDWLIAQMRCTHAQHTFKYFILLATILQVLALHKFCNRHI